MNLNTNNDDDKLKKNSSDKSWNNKELISSLTLRNYVSSS